jgi:hypothetical protein
MAGAVCVSRSAHGSDIDERCAGYAHGRGLEYTREAHVLLLWVRVVSAIPSEQIVSGSLREGFPVLENVGAQFLGEGLPERFAVRERPL